MQQRQLRLGDIIDDYCPRERRLANHTIVAMVGDDIRLTRCTTCDTEHPYKGGKVPRQRRGAKGSAQAAYDEVLESVKKDADIPGNLVTNGSDAPAPEAAPDDTAPAMAADADGANDVNGQAEPAPDEIRLHRPLIRASLPRVETTPTPRPIPEFTIHQTKRHGRFQNSRGARFAQGRSGGGFNGNGNSRGSSGGQGRPQGQGGPRRGGGNQGGGGRKRSR